MTAPKVCVRMKCRNVPKTRGLCNKHYRKFLEDRARLGISSFVDPERTRDHVAQLVARSISVRQIARVSGICADTIGHLMAGQYRTISIDTQLRLTAISIPTAPHHLTNQGRISAAGTARRLRALVAVGYLQQTLAERLGVKPTWVSFLTGEGNSLVLVATARRVEALYNELSATPGPSDRARRYAAKHGWAVPAAWDEDTIDDPTATPDLGDTAPASFLDRYEELVDLGYRDHQIAARLGIQLESLERSMYRAGLQPRRVAS
jgi:hypothetical protein